MPRFFKENFKDEPYIDSSDAAHITKSLRIKTGEEIIVCDGNKTEYVCSVTNAEPQRVDLEIKQVRKTKSEPNIEVTLCPCLMKGDKLEDVIKHSVELGVTGIIPLISSNCVSRPDAKTLKRKAERWQKIAAEAAGQSGRGIIPKVFNAESFADFCGKIKDFDLVLFFYEAGGESLKKIMSERSVAEKIAVITGPEGGFLPKEAELCENSGAQTVSLGKRILRAETAPLAAVTGIMLLTNNMA